MPPLPSVFGARIARALERHGFKIARVAVARLWLGRWRKGDGTWILPARCGIKAYKMRNFCSADAEDASLTVVDGSLTGIAPRQLTAVLARRLTEEPALVLNGPRTVATAFGTIPIALVRELPRSCC